MRETKARKGHKTSETNDSMVAQFAVKRSGGDESSQNTERKREVGLDCLPWISPGEGFMYAGD